LLYETLRLHNLVRLYSLVLPGGFRDELAEKKKNRYPSIRQVSGLRIAKGGGYPHENQENPFFGMPGVPLERNDKNPACLL
jgi:hypothetical protein